MACWIGIDTEQPRAGFKPVIWRSQVRHLATAYLVTPKTTACTQSWYYVQSSALGWVIVYSLNSLTPDWSALWIPSRKLKIYPPKLNRQTCIWNERIHWVTLTFDLAFRWAKVRSKSRPKSKSKVISLSESLRPKFRSKYILRPKLSRINWLKSVEFA